MDLWEKEWSFENRRKHAGDLWRYIPAKARPYVEDVTINADGYWIYLAKGYAAYDRAEDCGIIHEYNIKDLREAVKTIGPMIK